MSQKLRFKMEEIKTGTADAVPDGSNIKLLVVDGIHVLDQLQNLVGVADLVKSREPRLRGSEKKQQKTSLFWTCPRLNCCLSH